MLSAFWTGVSVFVPDRELEIRVRHFCTCIPFTSHLISLSFTITHPLSPSISSPLRHTCDVLFACIELNCSREDFVVNICKNTPVLRSIIKQSCNHDATLLYAENKSWCQVEIDLCKQEARNKILTMKFKLSLNKDPVQTNLDSVLFEEFTLFAPLESTNVNLYCQVRYECDMCSLFISLYRSFFFNPVNGGLATTGGQTHLVNNLVR